MKTLRGFMLGSALTLLLIGNRASAQGVIPSYVFLRDSSGLIYLTSSDQRVNIPIYPATDEQIQAVPLLDKWMLPAANGDGFEIGNRPDWAWSPSAPLAVAAPAPPAPAVAPAPSGESAVSFSGPSSLNTRLFGLAGGNYTVRWSAKPNSSIPGCYMGAHLKTTSSSSIGQLVVNQAIQGSGTQNGETQLYRLAAGGDYFFAVNSTCSWEISIAPQ